MPFRDRLINLDLWAGQFVSLRLPAYIEERWSPGRDGVYTAEEWSKARRSGYRGNDASTALLDSDAGYLEQLRTHNAAAVHAAQRLAHLLDFRQFDAVIEIGCGEMAQAYALTAIHPQVRYRATDFDPFVIEKCSRLRLLDHVEKAVVDASRLAAEDLRGFKLLVSWELIYALDESMFAHVLRTAHVTGVACLAATTQLLGPMRYLRRRWRDRLPGGRSYYAEMVQSGRFRMHGWNPSVGYYDRLARQVGMRMSRLWLAPPAAIDRFSFLLFEPL